MDRVIVHVDRQTHDNKGLLSFAEQENAERPILCLAHINNILIWIHSHPLSIELEVHLWEVIIALSHHIATLEFILVLSVHLFVKLGEKPREVILGQDDGAGAAVEDRVYRTFFHSAALLSYTAPPPSVLHRADGEAAAVARPEEVFVNSDVYHFTPVSHS